MAAFQIGDVVTLDYNDLLIGKDLTAEIARAYSLDGIGVLTVKNVPDYLPARKQLLPLAYQFATLPEEIKDKYVHPESYYSFGWSHGKENLQGKPDYSKGSYYNNPQYDQPTDNGELIKQFPSFVHPNIWPGEDCPELEMAFKRLGALIVSVGKLVARQCDAYVHQSCPTYPVHALENVLNTSICCKARLLYYFPNAVKATQEKADEKEKEEDFKEFSSWCGWHNDHGSLTGLTSAMFLDEHGNPVANPDPTAGLYVRNRRSELIKVNIPEDHIGFQIGETAQVQSGGFLQATPHAVRGSSLPQISRATFAVFMEPNWDAPMLCPEGLDASQAQSQSSAANLPPGVPALATRWRVRDPPQTFGEFTEETHKNYY